MASKLCEVIVKDQQGRKVKCAYQITGTDCPNRKFHLTKYKTGLCGIGAHEGLNPKNFQGVALPTCTRWQTCSCSCHETYDQMFQMSEMERVLVDNSTFKPESHTFWMPNPAELAASRISSNGGATSAPTIIESPAPDTVPATMARIFAPTATGRAAKGELEAQVKEACDVWLIDHPTPPQQQAYKCTPARVSEEIGKKYGIKNPSVGAIDAVWKRWALIGFAVIEKKPTRFVHYTEDGIKLTLEGCKERVRRNKRSSR